MLNDSPTTSSSCLPFCIQSVGMERYADTIRDKNMTLQDVINMLDNTYDYNCHVVIHALNIHIFSS